MDLKGSLIDTNLKIFPSELLLNYLKNITIDNAPVNILKIVKGDSFESSDETAVDTKELVISLSDKDIDTLKAIRKITGEDETADLNSDGIHNTELESKPVKNDKEGKGKEETLDKLDSKLINNDKEGKDKEENLDRSDSMKKNTQALYLNTSDIDWLYMYIQKQRKDGLKDVPYLHVLLEGSDIEMPENKVIKRNPDLEARCVKLRAQQEAREYRKMTRSVDNVRMRFPEDSISYQLKQVNRQLIAIGQFILSIFAGFLFGFKGVEWMIGSLDFGFRLLLGVMCALVIALAEIYFLAKKINEELNIPETVQLGGPPKFGSADQAPYLKNSSNIVSNKEHQD